MAPVFVVIDGSSLVHRAFYALPLLTTANGQYTNAVYGFTSMLTKLLADIKPDLVAVAFDKGRVTFRNDAYAQYKAQRKPTPSELSQQFPLIKEVLNALGIETIEEAGFEADDIIGTLATKAGMQGYDVIIVTGDRDALQLINSNVRVMLTKKGISDMEIYDTNAFREKYGLVPKQLIDLKGLMGDASDNIPGVPGIGEKTGLKLIRDFETVENLLENISQVSGEKLKEKLTNNSELAILSKKLATIVCDMSVEVELEKLKISPNAEQIKEVLERFEFKSLLPRVMAVFGSGCVECIDSVPELLPKAIFADELKIDEIINNIRENNFLCCYPVIAQKTRDLILGLAVYQNDDSVFIPTSACGWGKIVEVLAEESIAKVTYDSKRLYNMCLRQKTHLRGLIFDTLLAAYLLEPTDSGYPLAHLSDRYLGKKINLQTKIDDEDLGVWACTIINSLFPVLMEALKEANLTELNEKIELPLVEVLSIMEQSGIKIDAVKLPLMADDINNKVNVLLTEISSLAGEEFNVNSPKQLGQILFDKLQLPVIKKTKTGYSTDAEVLEKLSGQHPIIDHLLEYRMLTKLKSTYLDGMSKLINQETGRIHTTFNQFVTATGRLSSSEPNLQNIPVRTEVGKRIRELFIPGAEWKYIMSADYSQIELRVLAHISGDNNLVEAFTNNQDIHTRTASEVFGMPMDEVSSAMRGRAKAVNFGIVYGISDYGLSQDLGISRKEAAQYIDSYFSKYRGVKNYIEQVVAQARRDGFVTTLFGRRRYLPDINSSNFNKRSFAERTAMNTPIQGTAADIIKKAMIDVYQVLNEKKLRSRLLLQVHDELLLEVTEGEVELVSVIVKEAMENAASLMVPLIVDIKCGENWAKAK